MGIATHTKDIDGRQFIVNTFPARKSISILSRLTTLVGPGVAEGLKGLAGANGSASLDTELDYNLAGNMISELVARLDDDKVLRLILDMLECGQVQMIRKDESGQVTKITFDSQSLAQFDSEFSGSLSTIGKLLLFVLEVNYKDFFGKSGIGGLLQTIRPTQRPNQQSSTPTPDSERT